MQIGFVFPHYEMEPDPSAIKDLAQGAEALGFDYLLAYDHVLGANPDRPGGWRGPYTYQHIFHEAFVLFGYLAGITQTLNFATGILILPQRQTALVAKQAAQVDLLSKGRLRLGVGIGWNRVEYDALGEDFTRRGREIEQQVALLRRLWTEPLVTFEGERDNIDDAGINPLPVQRPIPIWFGGGADAVLRRMARLGNGWIPNTMPLEDARRDVEKLRGYLEAEGRDLKDFGIDVRLNVAREAQQDWGRYVETWRTLGMTHLCINTLHAGETTVAGHLRRLEQARQALDL